MPRRIGILVGEEESLSAALFERLAGEAGIEVELARIGATPERLVSRYDAILDRMSHRVPHYRSYLQAAAVAGTAVINDPFRSSADDKFVGLSLAARLGLPAARALLLPQHGYAPSIVPERSLRNLEHPLRWHAIADYVGLPALVRPARASLAAEVVVRDVEGLLAAYDASGEEVMVLQQHLEGAPFVRCLCAGDGAVVPLEVDPIARVYLHHDDDAWLAAPLRAQLAQDARRLSAALGYRLNAVDMMVVKGVGYVVDPSHPWLEISRGLLGGAPFERFVEALGLQLMSAARAG